HSFPTRRSSYLMCEPSMNFIQYGRDVCFLGRTQELLRPEAFYHIRQLCHCPGEFCLKRRPGSVIRRTRKRYPESPGPASPFLTDWMVPLPGGSPQTLPSSASSNNGCGLLIPICKEYREKVAKGPVPESAID